MLFLILFIAAGQYLAHATPCSDAQSDEAQRDNAAADAAPHDWGMCPGRTQRHGNE